MEWVVFAIVVVVGAVGLGQVGRQRLLDAADPASRTTTPPDPRPTLVAPQIDWAAHNPLRQRPGPPDSSR